MNERVRELKYQAEALAYEEHKANCIKNGRDPSIPHANALNITFEKFAELIVAECMTTVLKESKWYWDKDEFESSNAIQNAARRLKEHFGVEE